jgi:hypothetical protein
MGKYKARQNAVASDMMYRTSLLAGVCGLFAGLFLFRQADAPLALALSVGLAIATMALTTVTLARMFRPKSKIVTSFEFADTLPTQPTTAHDFEYEVASLIYKLTGKRTEVVSGTSEEGIDIKVYEPDGQLLGIVQCKNMTGRKTVHPAFIRELNTLRNAQQVKNAYLVSTGRFSPESQSLAEQLDVKLIDGDSLLHLRKQSV